MYKKKSKLESILILLLIIISTFPLSFIPFAKADESMIDPYIAPGAPDGITIEQLIKIGILDDMNHFSGEHAWMGAELAAKEINEAGGIDIDGTQYYIGLVANNTYEAEPDLDISKALNATNDMIFKDNPHYIIGGYTHDALLAYIEPIMDAKIPFIGTGCSSDIFCQNVLDNYTRYNYFFRVSPLNGTTIFLDTITYLNYVANYLTLSFGQTVNKTALIYEDSLVMHPFINGLRYYLPTYGIEIVKEVGYPLNATEEDFTNYWNQIDEAGAQIVFPWVIPDIGGIMAQTYGIVKPKCLMVGLDVLAQLDTYWNETNGGCQYEIIMQAIHNTSKTPLTISFWNNYIEEYDQEPIYTGVGSYNAIYLLANSTSNTQSFDPDIIVSELEKFNASNPFIGVNGNIAFTSSHDILEGQSYVTGLFCQWQEDGTKVVLPTGNTIYPDSWATGTLLIPEWGINQVYPYAVPGVSEIIPPDQILKIGLLDDMNHFSGEHAWQGALLAAREINEAGGINIDSTQYYVGLVAENTYEAQIELNLTKSVIAANRIISEYNPHFIIGGLTTNALIEYLEPVMDAKIPFIGTGCASENLSQNVLDKYSRYKYFFRTVLNSSSIGVEIITYLNYLPHYLTTILSKNVTKFALMYEDIEWTSGMINALRYWLPAFGYEIVKEIAFPLDATADDFINYWNQIDNAGAQLVFPMTSVDIGVIMAQTYGIVKPKCLMVGIDIFAQLDTYWNETNGGCQYEIIMQGIYNTSKTHLTIPFWNNYIEEYDQEPYFTGSASYNAVYLLKQVVNDSQSVDPDIIISKLEKINASNPFTGVGGNIAYTTSHDLRYGPSYVTGLFCQWQEDGTKVVLPTGNMIYPDSLATGTLMIPDWGINPTELDETPPETSTDVKGILGFDGWYLSDITIQLTAFDEDSGVVYTEYSFDEVNWVKYTEPILITDDGIITLYYRSFDHEGNIEDTKMKSFVKYSRPIDDPIFIFGTGYDPIDIDPHFVWDLGSFTVISQVVETLFTYNLSDPKYSIVPNLAADYGEWSSDGLNYTVSLKTGITFHDGIPFNASSVKWNFDRLNYFKNSSDIYRIANMLGDGSYLINRTEVVDTYTIKFVLNSRSAYFEALLTMGAYGILSPTSTSPMDHIDKLTDSLVGTGPFVLDEYKDGIGVKFHRYENYWQGAAKIEDLWYLVIPDVERRNNALISGIIDYLDEPLDSMIDTFDIDPNFEVVGGQTSTISFLTMNNNHINQTMRQAISYALDYTSIKEVTFENGIRMRSPIPKSILYSNWSFNIASMNVTHARKILVDNSICNFDIYNDAEWVGAAITNPIASYIYLGSYGTKDLGVILQQNLEYIGIKLQLDIEEGEEYWDRVYSEPNTYDFASFGIYMAFNDPAQYIWTFSNNSIWNAAQVNDPYLQGLIDQGTEEINPDIRKTIYYEIQRYLVEELMPWAYLFNPVELDIYNNRFKGYRWNPHEYMMFNVRRFYDVYPSDMDLTPPKWDPSDDTIPDELDLNYTTNPQIIGSIKIYDSSPIIDVQLVNMDPPYNGQADEGFSLSITHYPQDSNDLYRTDIVVLTNTMLERGVHHLKLIFYDEQGNIAKKPFKITVYRRLELQLSGEFDYLEAESIKLSIAAYLIDIETVESISPTIELPLIVKFYLVNPDGDILNTLEMEHMGLGVYRYVAEWTIEQLQFILTKGIYLVYGFVDFNSENHYYRVKEDVIQFHIDPPSGKDPNSWLPFAIGSVIGTVVLVPSSVVIFLKKRRKALDL